MTFDGFCGPTYESESVNADCQRSINLYPEIVESGKGVTRVAMYPTPGITPFASMAGTYVRGLYAFNGRFFGVGSQFCEIFSTGKVTAYSFLPDDGKPVTMAANNANQLIICAGGELWLFPLAPGSIVYHDVDTNISLIQIVDNGDPTVKDYYLTLASVPPYTVGTSVEMSGIGVLAFLNGLSGAIIDIVGNTIHLQMPRSLTSSFSQTITNLVLTASSPSTANGTASSGTGTGWVNAGNVASNVNYANYTVGAGHLDHGTIIPKVGNTPTLSGSGFGFNIPVNAEIKGIQVSFGVKVDDINLTASTQSVSLSKGTSKGGSGSYTTFGATETYGGSSDLWGTTWTPAELNAISWNFLVNSHYSNDDLVSHNVLLNYYQVSVTYVTYDGVFTVSSNCVFANGQSLTLAGLTHAYWLNGNSYTISGVSGSQFTMAGIPGTAYNGVETGTATGELVNYGPTADSGKVTGSVAYVSDSPVQVAVGQGPFASVDFVDGFFLARVKDSQNVQYSGLEDGTVWDALDYFQVTEFADNLVGMFVDHREIWCFGPKRTVPYYDSGDSLNPFQPIPGSLIEQGSAAEFAPVRMDNTICWIGQDERGWGVAWRAQGYQPVRISNHAIENVWRQYSTISDAVGYAYQDNGHFFWVLYFPSANATWVYDAATNQWHERAFFNTSTGTLSAARSRCHAFAFDKHMVGDISTGTVYWMDIALEYDNVPDSANTPIKRLRRAPHIDKEKQRVRISQLQVDVETGGGEADITLRYSKDSGHTWSDEYTISAGGLGEYIFRVIWRRLGLARDWVFEISTTSPTLKRFITAYINNQ